jgi:hypothetical protein
VVAAGNVSNISNLHARAPCDTLQAERVPPNDLAYRQYDAAATALPLIVAFFSGAFLASMAIESDFFGRTANGYAVALLGESTLLLLFTTISPFTAAAHPRVQDAELPTSGSRRPAGFAGGAARCRRWLESSSPSGELRRRGPRRSRSGCSGPSRRRSRWAPLRARSLWSGSGTPPWSCRASRCWRARPTRF